VTVISNSKGINDQASMWYAALNFYEELIKAGVSIREWKGTMKDTVHSKSMIVDDTMAVVGSYNLDTRSAWSNSEIVNILKGGAILSDMVTSFDKDYQNTKAGSYDLGWWDWWMMRFHRIPESLL
jgi:cardiolipin synthase